MERPRLAKHCISALTLTAPASQSAQAGIQLNHATSARPSPATEAAWTKADAETRALPEFPLCQSPYTAAKWRYRHSWRTEGPQKEKSPPSGPRSSKARSATESTPPFSSRCFHPFHIIMKQMNYIKKAIPVQDACTRRMRADVCLFYRKGHKCNDSPEKPFFSTGRVDIRFCRML